MTDDKTVETSVAEMQARLLILEKVLVAKDAQIEGLTGNLKTATDLIDGDTKSRLISELENLTDHTLDERVKMSTDELRQARDLAKRVPGRKFVSGADTGKVEGDVYEPISQKAMYKRYMRD